MIQGTGSDVGKSLIVAGLARLYARRGLRVRPFKPQNMSNNAAVTIDGGEIGRAQALQARAAGVAPSVHMNPVLLKPQSETGSQVVVQGRMVGTARAREYQDWKPRLLAAVVESFGRLQAESDLVLVEGAGSASEVNLRRGDIANMGFARATGTPVVLLGDIDRGGVIASIVGTKAVIDPEDAAMVRGFLVNRFRGDPSLFSDGMGLIAARTGWEALGLIPHFPDAARLPAEDVLGLKGAGRTGPTLPGAKVVAVPVLPRIANFDDLDPLRAEPGVSVVLVDPGRPIPPEADLVLLPGSKTTIPDLAFLRAQGWDIDILAHRRRGGRVLGLCGGYQMLGTSLSDPQGIEGPPGTVAGLGLLDVATVMTGEKRLAAASGVSLPDETPFTGYEMHVGETGGPDAARPLLRLADGRPDGAVSADGLVCGTYVHGLFAGEAQRALWLGRLGAAPGPEAYEAVIEGVLDRLADHLEAHVACERLLALAG
ncbi:MULTISPECIES: cobyric acid synthase [Methylobacterium]|uniref:cobyric acid synthase n=1 Tax=Methylobacterium TaxID=407 RepID=UPI0013EC4B99|nr:cobyric acid synthase [Methylobacterium sp. DB0501]NGM33834.1 cobyric acid synthase [Methylobacterium sp. DB0501]